MNQFKHMILVGLVIVFLSGCLVPAHMVPTNTEAPTVTDDLSSTKVPAPTATDIVEPMLDPTSDVLSGTDGYPWWNDVIFYQIFVRSFYDSDGDGIGDFQGLIQKLDYLNDGDPTTTDDLGIGGIWLMPIFPSPSYHGYDVTDYYDVNPDYGTMDDFKQLLAEAHQRGIRVIVDFVINHTSSQHPWFIEAQDIDSDFHDWYVWSALSPSYQGPWGQQVWHKAANGLAYYAVFWSGMPDLNYRNPDVQQEILNISDFWQQEVGVDGFRVDGARYLFANGGAQSDQPQTLAFFEAWRQHYKANESETFVVGEVWTTLDEASVYDPTTGMDTIFVFDLSDAIIDGVRNRYAALIQSAYLDTMAAFDRYQFSTFLTNHDVNRVMNQLAKNPNKMRLASFIYLTGPGVPFIYYGEEIGMLGTKPDEEIRTPMQWTSLENAGFTIGIPWIKPKPDYEEKNVALQMMSSDSLLSFYQTLIHLRNENPALRLGSYLPLKASAHEVYAVLRATDEQKLLLVANLSLLPLNDISLSLSTSSLEGTYTLRPLLGDQDFPSMTFDENGALDPDQLNVDLAGGEILIFVLE